jgi:hypothetical protein
MNPRRVVARETALSVAINGLLSLLFFLAVFGTARPVAWPALAVDGLPQSFMVALMGSLVPGLIVGARLGRARGPIVRRALLFAAAALLLLGGGGWLLLHGRAGTVAAGTALAAKVAYGAALGAIVTPAALSRLFKDPAA